MFAPHEIYFVVCSSKNIMKKCSQRTDGKNNVKFSGRLFCIIAAIHCANNRAQRSMDCTLPWLCLKGMIGPECRCIVCNQHGVKHVSNERKCADVALPLRRSGGGWVFSARAFAGHNLWPLWWSISSYSDGFCSIIVHYGERWPHHHATDVIGSRCSDITLKSLLRVQK